MHLTARFTRRLFNSENFAGSAALAEVCALLSAVLVHRRRPPPLPHRHRRRRRHHHHHHHSSFQH